jgi:hypothetical protein
MVLEFGKIYKFRLRSFSLECEITSIFKNILFCGDG